jgi:hypothetical protein
MGTAARAPRHLPALNQAGKIPDLVSVRAAEAKHG